MIEKYLKQLIQFKTTPENHEENEKAFLWIKKIVKPYGLYVVDEKSNGFPSLIITTRKTKKPKIWLSAHMDVVSAQDNFFHPVIKNGKMYGRGTYDMKFAIACYLKLLYDMKSEISKHDFGIMLTSDEELDGKYGVKYLLQKGYASKICFVPDGGHNWKMEKGAKGIWDFIATAKGISAHPSTPWQGVNAIEELMAFLQEIKEYFAKFPKRKNNDGVELNIDSFTSGSKDSRVPDFAQAFVDVFFPDENTYIKLRKEILQKERRYPDITIQDHSVTKSYSTDVKNPFIKKFISIARASYGKKIDFALSHSTSDARYFAYKNIPTLAIKPIGGGQHSDSEWIDLNDVKKYYEVLKKFIISLG